MARGTFDDLFSLVDTLRAARDLVAREASLGQACAESEARLAGLREQEAASSRKLGEARSEAKRLLDEVKDDCQVARDACERACQTREAAADQAVRDLLQQGHTECDVLSDEANELRARVAQLETEEADLGQKVAALRAAIDDLRSKLA